MEELEQKYNELRRSVEQTLGCEFNTPKDFDMLALRLLHLTKCQVSASTLRRLWGYQEKGVFTPRRFTLNALSVLAGFKSWQAFCEQYDNKETVSSNYILNNILKSSSLLRGDYIRFVWKPDRHVMAHYIGQGMFVVESRANCKLQVGDTFYCNIFIENQPLTLHTIIRKNSTPLNLVCGINGGIKYTLIPGEFYRGREINRLNIRQLWRLHISSPLMTTHTAPSSINSFH